MFYDTFNVKEEMGETKKPQHGHEFELHKLWETVDREAFVLQSMGSKELRHDLVT